MTNRRICPWSALMVLLLSAGGCLIWPFPDNCPECSNDGGEPGFVAFQFPHIVDHFAEPKPDNKGLVDVSFCQLGDGTYYISQSFTLDQVLNIGPDSVADAAVHFHCFYNYGEHDDYARPFNVYSEAEDVSHLYPDYGGATSVWRVDCGVLDSTKLGILEEGQSKLVEVVVSDNGFSPSLEPLNRMPNPGGHVDIHRWPIRLTEACP